MISFPFEMALPDKAPSAISEGGFFDPSSGSEAPSVAVCGAG